MTFKPVLLACLLLTLAACAVPPLPGPTTAQGSRVSGLSASAFLNELSRVATLSPEQRRRELAALDNERRLDDARRFQQAALLEREDTVEAFERSLKSLAAIDDADPRVRALFDLMKKSLAARIELRQQTARAQELQDKLDQIKALEKTLQQRNTLPKSP
jgi:predicted RNase H-like nuclease (RuvC/YqgF family)